MYVVKIQFVVYLTENTMCFP